ncbi:Hypothetical predicted protein [Paramuricea clavata]|uniref:Endonuclease/exonuclease/phosphatase domain-containing protein n=2 Tax=Paramuricea clavata TaxID=317549 RepID=A0A6S7G4A7_PARCT|nr:Hypothetical predicted protein [Paramuricea clavata]
MKAVRVWLFCVVGFLAKLNTEVSAKNLVVATYNLWNVMFQWDSRKYYIADMIHQANPDIIGFQEARADANGKRNQLKQLQTLLPEYKYHVFHSTRTVDKNKFGKNAIKGWEQEGLGILSKYSIVMSHHIPLSKAGESDESPRVLLHIQIEYEHHEIFFMVVHFSTNKKLQCQNAMRLINFVSSTGADRTVIVGDFNTYSDYEWPVAAVLNGFFLPNGCPKPVGFEPVGAEQGYGFDDSWPMTNLDKKGGLTFSNMVSLSRFRYLVTFHINGIMEDK